MATSMQNDRRRPVKEKSVAPSYGPGNSLYSATESISAQDIETYFRIIPTRSSSTTNSLDNSTSNINERKTVQYLRPTSFEDQQKQMQQSNKNKMDIIPYATFHEKYIFVLKRNFILIFDFFKRKQLLPIDQRAHPQDFQQRFDNEFLQVK
jgi:hypothetical protein